jgi:biopolymer transport protein ExbD
MSQRFKGPAAEESVACNLIPMIDIMFLLLLFFMLGADMSQRELEEVELPQADQVKQEDKNKVGNERIVNVNVYHTHTNAGYTCPVHAGHGICRDLSHWAIAIQSNVYTLETIKMELKELAELDLEDPGAKTNDPKAPPLSKVEIMIRADKNAPYAYIQRIIESCGAVGLYKIAVGAAQPEGAGGGGAAAAAK